MQEEVKNTPMEGTEIPVKSIRLINEKTNLYNDGLLVASTLFAEAFGCYPNVLGLIPSDKLAEDKKNKLEFDIEKTIKYLSDSGKNIEVRRSQDVDENGVVDNKQIIIILKDERCIITSREVKQGQNIYDFHEVYYDDYAKVEALIKDIWANAFSVTRAEDDFTKKIWFVVQVQQSFDLKSRPLGEVNVSVENNYNDDFLAADEAINKFIDADDKSGLVILNGAPGTGKTYYLRHLINTKNRRFVFIDKNLIDAFTSPSFTSFLANLENAVIILEDCESLMISRKDGNRTSAVGTLLNMCDGLMSDAFKMKIIATFNADLTRVDNALLRKGRCQYMYTFKPLETDKANALAEELYGEPGTFDKPTPLCDIYNIESNNSSAELISAVGFEDED